MCKLNLQQRNKNCTFVAFLMSAFIC